MRRNTSFFWASDDLIRENSDDDGDDDDELGGWSVGRTSDETQSQDTEDECVTLNKAFDGYGSTHHERSCSMDEVLLLADRRRLFEPSRKEKERSRSVGTKSIRFQVVIWHLGTIDVQTGHVKMRFRLTMFWNDDDNDSTAGDVGQKEDSSIWVMEGRQHAYRKEWNHENESTVKEIIDVPPVSILNAVEFETVDEPEIAMVNAQTRGMRWTCMYNATLFQGDHLSVKDFPHDEHQIKLKLGLLAHRVKGGRWDHNSYRLGLAREEDSLGSTCVPHGLVVEHCHIPDFGFDPSHLDFRFLPLHFGGRKYADRDRDVYLQVTLPVHRQSGHYDTSILPILITLNIVAISCLTRNFGSASAATEIMLSIAFVQVGIRLTLDSRLPSVGYQIKMQRVMNGCFWLLCGLVLESNMVFFLVTKRGWDIEDTDRIDLAAACVALVYNVHIAATYFRGRKRRRNHIVEK